MSSVYAVYEVLRTAGLVSSQEKFSTDFLQQKPSYLSATKSVGPEPSLGALTRLAFRLRSFNRHLAQSKALGQHPSRDDLIQAENQLWEEIEKRALTTDMH